MNFQWEIFVAALGLAIILEGLPWFIGPEAYKKALAMVQDFPSSYLRVFGLIAIIAGLALVALSRALG